MQNRQIVMEYCGGGSCADLIDILEEGCDEDSIRYIISEALKVRDSPNHFFSFRTQRDCTERMQRLQILLFWLSMALSLTPTPCALAN